MKRRLLLVLALSALAFTATRVSAQPRDDHGHADHAHPPTAVEPHDAHGHAAAPTRDGDHASHAADVHAAAGDHGEHEAASPFAGTIYQSAAAIIVFVLLLVILKAKAWGPILKGLQDREHKIKQDLEAAEAAMRKANATLADYQAKVTAAQNESREIIDRGRREAERIAAQVQEETRAEVQGQKARALAEINYAKEQAVADLYAQAAELGTHVASRILKREIRPQDQQQLVQDSLAELKAETLN